MLNKANLELGMSPSMIRKLFEYSKKRKEEIGENNVFDFSIGNPSFKTPDKVNNELIDLIKNTDPVVLHSYSSSSGMDSVKKVIKNNLYKKYQINVDEKCLYLTCGAAASLTISLHALINEGDEIIIIAPYFPEYKIFIENAHGKVVILDSEIPSFLPNLVNLEKLINEKTKGIIINSPVNPTGVLYKDETLKQIADILNKKQKEYHHNIYLLSDEPYRELIYDGLSYPHPASYYDNTIICYSYSKSLSLPGERIGYIALNDKIENKQELFYAICGSGRALGFVCAPVLFQRLIERVDTNLVDINLYQDNRDYLYHELINIGYEVVKPEGAFYIFIKALEDDSYNFIKKALKYELIMVPSDSFGVNGYARIAYCVKKDLIEKSIESFKKLYLEYKEKRNE